MRNTRDNSINTEGEGSVFSVLDLLGSRLKNILLLNDMYPHVAKFADVIDVVKGQI